MELWLPLPQNYNWVMAGSSTRAVIQNICPNPHKTGTVTEELGFWDDHLSPLT